MIEPDVMRYRYHDSPLGSILLAGKGGYLHSLTLPTQRTDQWPLPGWHLTKTGFSDCLKQLDEYFQGKLQTFSLNLSPQGTAFQRQVWDALLHIPYGETRSYQDIARAIKNPKAVRAVGGSNARNPIAIIIPCHRVIGANGKLTGYAGGLQYKRALLDLERNQQHIF
jgi:methylated-DNA-[protein]-cysteine S-methyltransferase